MASTEELARYRERLADLRHWHERSPSSYQALPEMAEWLEEAWRDIEALTVDLDQAQRDLATAQAQATLLAEGERRARIAGYYDPSAAHERFIVLPPLPDPDDDLDPSPYG